MKEISLRDTVIAFAVGDALGVPYEFKKRGRIHCEGMAGFGSHRQPAGTWSDDTSMVLATCYSLKENNGKVNVTDMREQFNQWMKYGAFTPFSKCFGIGQTTFKALMKGKGQTGERCSGNGSLMIILPLAFTDCSEEDIRDVSEITHGNKITGDACIIYCHLLRHMMNGERDIANILSSMKLQYPFDRLSSLCDLKEEEIYSSGYVIHTLEASLWCVQSSNSFREALTKAVELGGDTDTIAALAAGVGVFVFGKEDIPEEWIEALQGKEYFKRL